VVVELQCVSPTRAMLLVKDNGPGPSPEIADKLFEPFVTNKAGGVGLGLSVARHIAEAHGGSISFQRTGNWTCFAVELPLEDS
jgi:two-component system sensor kinase FixL